MLRVHILPRFGNHRLDEISRNDIKAFAVDLRTHVAPVTARSIITVLGLVLREAIEEHYLYFDPTHRLRLRDGDVVPKPMATPEQVLQIADRMPNRITRTLVITAAYTGIRIVELLAQDAGSGYVSLVARHSGKCLDVSSGSTADGTRLIQYTCSGGQNQHFLRGTA